MVRRRATTEASSQSGPARAAAAVPPPSRRRRPTSAASSTTTSARGRSLQLALAMRDAPGLAAALAQMRRRGLDRGMDAQAVAAAERALRERR